MKSPCKVIPLPTAKPLPPVLLPDNPKQKILTALLATAQSRPENDRLAAVEAKLDEVLFLLQKGAAQ
jgi:hypothetical protein